MSRELPTDVKLTPVNLTARAADWPQGNPVGSRPESGVDNCYPGLEFDQRNLDTVFFPGLVFDFYRNDGASLTGVQGSAVNHLVRPLLDSDARFYLWALAGSFAPDQPSIIGFRGLDGLSVWRRVHDLVPGRLVLVIGRGPSFSSEVSELQSDIISVYRDEQPSVIRRNPDGEIIYVVLSGERSSYLDEQGVIDPEVLAPGELTQTLCAPWMYDFRDCGCFYWASNKPDVAEPNPENADAKDIRYVNFLRRDRKPVVDNLDIQARGDSEYSYADLVNGRWEDGLPVVLFDHEHGETYVADPGPAGTADLTPEEVRAELFYLATVEHALTVEYLYSRYSFRYELDNPTHQKTVDAAGHEILHVAIDEMRHFRWVNQILNLLGAPPSIGRAEIIGQTPPSGSARRLMNARQYMDRPFSLKPATIETLDDFVEVERPSQVLGEGIDGMYVELLKAIEQDPGSYSEAERLIELIKLIIDEGEGHFERFLATRNSLADLGEDTYLRQLDGTPGTEDERVLELADLYYEGILKAIQVNFSLGAKATGRYMQAAVRSMHSLDEVGLTLGRKNYGLRFTLPDDLTAVRLTKEAAHATVQSIGDRVDQKLVEIANSNESFSSTPLLLDSSAVRQRNEYADLVKELRANIDEEYEP